ncbi:Uncharacterized membrane-anchored protein YitT, contains DUF161 and DUF2179 domains [Alkalithermobacter thermoalcaliphilus JW-YL-7 = DSM 7308]|uniref:Uncharacterized membrane-anchored protein YitT, contains DUF161 and DUF2179 domains n=1 Tax=Alkalithermobacter thermoalcaliphilus JW-YL-7 = DSM 7308 TaxID=1121328 RepID=A0A150FSC3_CLOPD|nr:Protein of unknown function DUF2179 [[Clostridium] paradoxum JW-YL-7 = DSM 7308]SHK72478.1 Uncharacterized membrane-anchored protein YitT, contains DUF161 and DUF2179 domains [[Clostridium] paradoxum JW-YL-7 = DSM 7308]
MKKHWYNYFMEYLTITIGCALMAIALNMFLEPNTIAPGGVTGLAIVVKKITNIPVSITNLVINIPLFIIGLMVLGKMFGAKTAYGTVALSFFIEIFLTVFKDFVPTTDLFLSAVYGGVILGIGIGLVFKAGGTTGGTDLAGAILNKFFPSLSTAKLMMVCDLFIVVLAGIVDKNIETSLYSTIALYIIVKVADFIVDGMGYAKAFFIISDCKEQISKEIMEKLDRGITALKGRGIYSGLDKEVLLVVVDRAQEAKLKEIVKTNDPDAFIIVTGVHEVLGEGFKAIQ